MNASSCSDVSLSAEKPIMTLPAAKSLKRPTRSGKTPYPFMIASQRADTAETQGEVHTRQC